jgi:hypothetical protein
MGQKAVIAEVDDGAEPAPGRAMRVAHALKARDNDEFAKPGNLVEVRFVKGQSARLDDPDGWWRCLAAHGPPDA